jgi:alkyl hydroperoxide reductase subunit AhpC
MAGMSPPLVGSPAPAFDLPCTPMPGSGRRRARLDDFRGRWLALVFYPRDFSLVCPTELTALGAHIAEFRRQNCELLGISTDTLESHERWLETPRTRGGLAGLGFALASDEEGAASEAYGVLVEPRHAALRGLFLIDPEGVLQYQLVHNMSVGRRAEDVLRVLAALQTGGLCVGDWSPGDPTLDPTRILGPGSVVAHYQIEETLGDGSFGAVFRARDLTLQRPVALKVLKPGAPHSALAEARAAASLSHPNICTIFAVEDGEGVPLIAMEYLSGLPLSRLLARRGPLPLDETLVHARQVAAGLAAAHGQGVVHGDLKPENVMVTDEGVVKLLDFGLARRVADAVDPDRTIDYSATGEEVPAGDGTGFALFGTPAYMSPEQTRGEPPTAASDVFAFGVLAYEMATGRKAFTGENLLQTLSRVRSVVPDRLAAELPEPLSGIVRVALEAKPDRRAFGMAEIVERLNAY